MAGVEAIFSIHAVWGDQFNSVSAKLASDNQPIEGSEDERRRLAAGMVKAPLVEKAFHTMPLSLSVMNVMDGLRGTQDMVVVGESAVNEASTPIDYVGSGSQVITLNIKQASRFGNIRVRHDVGRAVGITT